MINVATASRADLETAILEYDILPTDAAGCDRIAAMSTDDLRAAVTAWVESGDECAR